MKVTSERIPFLPAITALHAVPAQRFQTRCWRRRVWVGRPARCPPASSILAQGDLTAWLRWSDSNSEMPSQNIPLKGRTDSRDPAEFWPQRLFAFELRCRDTQLGPGARISAGVPARTEVDR